MQTRKQEEGHGSTYIQFYVYTNCQYLYTDPKIGESSEWWHLRASRAALARMSASTAYLIVPNFSAPVLPGAFRPAPPTE